MLQGENANQYATPIVLKIMRLCLFSLFLMIGLSGCDKAYSEDDWLPSIVRRARSSVAKVYAMGEDGRGKSGTGFAININSETVILTGKHVVHGAKVVIVETESDTWIAEKWSEHSDLDMAKISLRGGAEIPALDMAPPGSLEMGDAVATLGYPLGYDLAIHEGTVSSTDGLNVVFSAPLSTGASGSPLLSKGGQVVGICYSFVNDAQNYNLAIPSELFLVQRSWKTIMGDGDLEIRTYLGTIRRVKEFQRRCLQEWEMIGEEFPEHKPWIDQTQSTRRNLLRTIEGVSLAVHGVDWHVVREGNAKRDAQSSRLANKLKDMNSAWDLHLHNIKVADELFKTRIPSIPSVDGGVPLFQEAGRQLAGAISSGSGEKLSPETMEGIRTSLLSYFKQEISILRSGVP